MYRLYHTWAAISPVSRCHGRQMLRRLQQLLDLAFMKMLLRPLTLAVIHVTGFVMARLTTIGGDIHTVLLQGHIPLADSGADQWKVGLRHRVEDAIERESKVGGTVRKDTHVVLKIRFSALGLAHFTTLCQARDGAYRSLLQKQVYRDNADWKVWHFGDHLPLNAVDEQDRPLITAEMMLIW